MPYIIEKLDEKLSDAVSSPDSWVQRDPAYAGLFESNRELQNQHVEPGTHLDTPDWKLVATYPSTLEDAISHIENGGVKIIKDKKTFYAWLSRNRQYAAYDAKFGRA